MNEHTLTQLQIVVERAVRPVRTASLRKDMIRQELLAHLIAVYEEHFARRGNEVQALNEATSRFGQPAELARELQASISWKERAMCIFEHYFHRRPAETGLSYLRRSAVMLLLFNAAIMALTVGIVELFEGIPPREFWMRLRGGGSFVLIQSADILLLGIAYHQMRKAICSGVKATLPWRKVAAWGVLSSLIVSISLLTFFLLSTGELTTDMAVCCYRMLAFAVALPLCMAAICFNFGPAQLRHRQWEMLDINS